MGLLTAIVIPVSLAKMHLSKAAEDSMQQFEENLCVAIRQTPNRHL
jgi:hypothetical protein